MICLAPRALRNCAPSALSAVVVRPLNFTVRAQMSDRLVLTRWLRFCCLYFVMIAVIAVALSLLLRHRIAAAYIMVTLALGTFAAPLASLSYRARFAVAAFTSVTLQMWLLSVVWCCTLYFAALGSTYAQPISDPMRLGLSLGVGTMAASFCFLPSRWLR